MRESAVPAPTVRRFGLRTNALTGIGAMVVANAAAFLVNVLIVRFYGETAHGRFTLVMSYVQPLVVLLSYGLIGLAVRNVAALAQADLDEAGDQINTTLGLAIAAVLAAGLGLVLLAGPIAALQGQPIAPLLRLAATWPLALVLLGCAGMIGSAFESIPHNLLNHLVFHGVQVGWLIVAATTGLDLEVLFLGWTIALPLAGVLTLMGVGPLVRRAGVRLRPRLTRARAVAGALARSTPFLLAHSGIMLIPAAVQILIGRMEHDAVAVSAFQVSNSLSLVVAMIAVPLAGAMYPRISRLYATEEDGDGHAARATVQSVFVQVAALSALVVGATALAGRWALATIFQPSYAPHAPLLNLLAIAAAADVLRLVVDQALFALGREKLVGRLEALRYGIAIAGAAALLPGTGLIGVGSLLACVNVAAVVVRVADIRAAGAVALGAPATVWVAAVAAMAWLGLGDGPWTAALIGVVAAAVLGTWPGRATPRP